MNQEELLKLEQDLINLINRVDSEIQTITQKLGTNHQAIIINGLTGVGKSTIFNWLMGADFIYDKALKVDNDNNQYSRMNNGINPVTLNPIIQKIQDTNLYIIDLPGMESSDWLQNLYLDLILEKLSKKVSLKGLYVLNQQSDDLNDDRQQKFISYTKKYLLHDVNNVEKIILIANKYTGETSVSDFAKKIKEYLIEYRDFQKKNPNTVHVIKKITNDQKLKEYFSKVAKESLINDMLQANQLNIKVSSFDALEVNKYLSSQSFYFCNIVNQRIENLLKLGKKNNQNDKQVELCQFQNEQINKLYFLLQMTKFLVQQNNLDDEFNYDDFKNFAKIFSYFVQIEGVLTNQGLLKDKLEKLEKSVNKIIEETQQINLSREQTQIINQSIIKNADQKQQVALQVKDNQSEQKESKIYIFDTSLGKILLVIGTGISVFCGISFLCTMLSPPALCAAGGMASTQAVYEVIGIAFGAVLALVGDKIK